MRMLSGKIMNFIFNRIMDRMKTEMNPQTSGPSSGRLKGSIVGLCFSLSGPSALASPNLSPLRVLENLRAQLSSQMGHAEVKFPKDIVWQGSKEPRFYGEILIQSEGPPGTVHFSVVGDQGQRAQGSLTYEAWVPAKIAVRRIRPGEVLKEDLFVNRKINVASGLAGEYRGVLFSPERELSELEMTQTLLEGQFLTTPAVRAVPAVRRGDVVRIQLMKEGLVLTTSGIAQEPGYVHQPIRVLTSKTKKELLGQLLPDAKVEVKL
ncbi:MAG: flagellar basal body P-ring formation chaperone FlgA [Bdellovibrionia bacterium]